METKESRDVADSKDEMKISPPRKGRRERQDDESSNLVSESVNTQNGMESYNPANKPRRKPGNEGNNNTQDSNNNWMDMTMDSSNSKLSVKEKKTEDEPTVVK